MKKKETLPFHEFEVKFRVDESKLNEWKQICTDIKNQSPKDYKGFIYVDSDDEYFTKASLSEDLDYEFVRYRYSENEKRAELTTKRKLKDSNNIIRKEQNVRVDGNSKQTIHEFITEGLGYDFNFKISKYVQIYIFKEATLPFYTVIDDKGSRDTFVEIEVNEELLHSITEAEAWDIIKKYEGLLSRLGISSKNRLRKSLFEMYKKENI